MHVNGRQCSIIDYSVFITRYDTIETRTKARDSFIGTAIFLRSVCLETEQKSNLFLQLGYFNKYLTGLISGLICLRNE